MTWSIRVLSVLRSSGGGVKRDGAWRGMVTIFELIDPRPYKNLSLVYTRLIYSVIYMSESISSRKYRSPFDPLSQSA